MQETAATSMLIHLEIWLGFELFRLSRDVYGSSNAVRCDVTMSLANLTCFFIPRRILRQALKCRQV